MANIENKREIKFRVWDAMIPTTKEAIEGLLPTGGMVGSEYVIASHYLRDAIVGKYPLMQYTGLKDRNGVEIYEGDVCRFDWNPLTNEPSTIFSFTQVVQYYDGWGCYTFHLQPNKMAEKQRELFEDYSLEELHVAIGSPIMYGDGLEVIGNIYQNPELLQP